MRQILPRRGGRHERSVAGVGASNPPRLPDASGQTGPRIGVAPLLLDAHRTNPDQKEGWDWNRMKRHALRVSRERTVAVIDSSDRGHLDETGESA